MVKRVSGRPGCSARANAAAGGASALRVAEGTVWLMRFVGGEMDHGSWIMDDGGEMTTTFSTTAPSTLLTFGTVRYLQITEVECCNFKMLSGSILHF